MLPIPIHIPNTLPDQAFSFPFPSPTSILPELVPTPIHFLSSKSSSHLFNHPPINSYPKQALNACAGTIPLRQSLSRSLSFSASVASCSSRSSRFFFPVASVSSLSIRSLTFVARIVVRGGRGVRGGDNEDGDEGGLSFGGVRIGWSLSESNQHRTTTSGSTEIHGENAIETGKSRAVVWWIWACS